LRKVAPDSLGAKIIKTISLIYIIEQFEKLPPVYDIIIETFYDTTHSTQSISDALNELIEKDCQRRFEIADFRRLKNAGKQR
jgi:hypothetical protein